MARCCCVLLGHEDCPHETDKQCMQSSVFKCRCSCEQLPDSPVCAKCAEHMTDPGFTILKVLN